MDPDSPQDVQHPANFNSVETTGSYPHEMNFKPRDDHPESIHAVDMGCCPFEMNFSKQHQSTQQTNGSLPHDTENFIFDNPTNGKHENGSANFHDDEEDEEDDDDDLGPETDVDAVDEAGASLEKISRELFPEKSHSENDKLQKEENLDDSQTSTDSKSRQNELLPEADIVADSEDSEDEWNYYRVEPDKDKDSPVLVNETSSESKEEKDECTPKPLIEDDSENEHLEEEFNCNSKSETEIKIHSSELLDTECSADTRKPDEDITSKQESEEDCEKMDSHLNPNAKEFIPPSMFPQRITDFPIAGSPLKQIPTLMDDMPVPSQTEFDQEISHRPSDIEDEDAQLSKPLEQFDDSEISSTKAEFGDESTMSFLTTSEFQKAEVSAMDFSFADSERGDYDIAKDPMAMSFTPGDFEAAFEKEVDLNAVHDLTDVDFSDNMNGFENDATENCEKASEEKESRCPFGEKSETQNPFNMENLKESLNDENLGSTYSETESKKVNDSLLDTNAVPLTDSQHVEQDSEFLENQRPLQPQSLDLFGNEIIEKKEKDIAENQECPLDNKESPFENKECPFDNKETLFDNKESPFENKESLFENKDNLFANKENILETKETVFQNNDISLEDKENLFECKKENLLDSASGETPDFEPEIQTQSDIEFDPEIQEKSQTQFELSLDDADQLQSEDLDLGKFSEELEKSVPLEIEQKTNYAPLLNLSESLQEFTGLEKQISEAKELENVEYAQVRGAAMESIEVAMKNVENLIKDNDLVNIEVQKGEEPKSETIVVSAVAAAGAAVVVATTTAVSATKKPTTATSKSSTLKTSTTTKTATKSMPTSPTKMSTTARTAATTAKKPAAGAISRPKQLDTKPATNTASKAGAFKAAPVPKTSSTAPKITPRLTAGVAKPKTPLSSPKPASAADKKSTLNGDVKSMASKTTAPKPITKPTGTTATKSTLVKSSSTTRTSVTSAAPAKPKPISATTKTTSTVQKTATATSRPKTAPATTGSSVGAVKPRVTAAKSPVIDKQIKETANKQISSRVSSAPLKSSRTAATTLSSTTTAKRMSTVNKTSTASSPTKKAAAPITKTNTKTAVPRPNGKTIIKSKPVQNGNCELNKIETVVTTTTTTTTNIEEDVPKKDISPIAPPTDNQLITSE